MAASPRTVVKTLYQKLQDQYKVESVLLPKERELLEHLIYAAFLENTPAKTAFSAFETLEDYFIDWNEIRVTTTSELADVLSALPFAQRAAERLRRTLQWIFDTTYKFDLEEWRKKDAKEFGEFLASNPFGTRFMHDYVLHFAFGATSLPFDEGALRAFRLLDLVEINDENKESVRGMERTFARGDADAFFTLLHQLGTEMMADSVLKKTLKFFKAIDPESDQRSYLPLVESDDDKDPAQIAREMAALKQPRRPKPPMLLDLDDVDLLDENAEEEFLAVEDEESSEVTVSFEAEEEVTFEVGTKPDGGKRPKKAAKEKAAADSAVPLDGKKSAGKESKKSKPPEEKSKKSKADPAPAKEKKSQTAEKSASKKEKKAIPAKPVTEKKTSAKSGQKALAAEKTAPVKGAAKKADAVKKPTEKKAAEKKSQKTPSDPKGGKGRKPPEKAVSRPPDDKGKTSKEKAPKGNLKKTPSKKPR